MAWEDSIMPDVRLLAAISAGEVLGALAAILAARITSPPRSFSVIGAVFALRSRRGERSCFSPTMPSPR